MPLLLLNIDFPDIAAGEACFTTALGLQVGRRVGPEFVELLGAPSPIYLLKKESGTSIGPAGGDTRRYDRHWSPIHPDFVVEDMDMAIERAVAAGRSEEHTSELQSLMRISYAVFCLKKKKTTEISLNKL